MTDNIIRTKIICYDCGEKLSTVRVSYNPEIEQEYGYVAILVHTCSKCQKKVLDKELQKVSQLYKELYG